jgi:hypothetical protein
MFNSSVKISMIVLALVFAGCTQKQSKKNPELEKALNSSPSFKAACDQIRADAVKICGSDPQCKMKDVATVKTALTIIQNAPYLQKSDVDMLNTFLKIEKPTRADVNMGTNVLGRDCWSVLTLVPWKGILGAAKAKIKGIDKEKDNIKKLFRDRVFMMDANLPTFIKLSVKFVLMKEAGASGLFKMEKGWEKGLVDLEAKMKSVRMALNTEYTKLLAEDAKTPQGDPEKQKFDPVAVSAVMKKDLALTQSLGRELNAWISKYILD